MSIYLGFDSSTQGLTAIAIEVDGASRRVAFQRSLNFDENFPRYGTTNGVLPQADPLVATSSPLMWAEALDRMMGIIATESGIDVSNVRAVSGSGQQHGSVYLNATAGRVLPALDPQRPLADQIGGIFSRPDSPIWMDSSTATQCEAITRAIGGARALSELTGSRAFGRFTGPQIRKFFEHDPAGYARTTRVHLVSSFMASLLAGADAPIEPGDGAGMNLMDIAARAWAPRALDATAPGLGAKLPALEPSWAVAGRLSAYWTKRYGFPAARVIAWSGDNPCSLVGTGLIREGRIAISLGTSDTLFGFMPQPKVDPSGTGHVFGSPTGGYMSLICFKNGSLARERIRDGAALDWGGFSRALRETAPGNAGRIMLPWFDAEITP
jgi:xylulokinase